MDMAQIMFYVYYVAMAGVVFGVVATASQDSIWSSVVLFFNIIFAFLFALNFTEPAAAALSGLLPEGAFYWDIVVYMLVLSLVLLAGRAATRALSAHRVKFPDQIENAGKYAVAFLPAIALVGVLAVGMQVAPLPMNLNKEPLTPGGSKVLGDENFVNPASNLASFWSYGPFAPIGFNFDPVTGYYNEGDKFISNYAARRAYFGSQGAAQKGMFIPDK